jgi:hypothetical protein
MMEIKKTLGEALSTGENCIFTADSGQGAIFFKQARTLELVISN